MDLILITADPKRALLAATAGVDRVLVDLETVGKRERQGHLDTWISDHSIADVHKVRRVVTDLTLMVRVNPWPHARREIDAAIGAGADALMLPMFTSAQEVAAFVSSVGGRVRTSLLLETPQAAREVSEILDVPGVDELHIGLNDLHLGSGARFIFEPLVDGTVERIAEAAHLAKVRFGFGGVGRLTGTNIVSPGLILSEHVRLGSQQVILSRDFHRALAGPTSALEFSRAVEELRRSYDHYSTLPAEALNENARELQRVVAAVASRVD